MFVHEALVEALKCGETAIPIAAFRERYPEICESGEDGESEIDRQFKVRGRDIQK